MTIKFPYEKRPIRFVEIFQFKDWYIKVYSISNKGEIARKEIIKEAKLHLDEWLGNSNSTDLAIYKYATLIIHEGKEGCYAIVNWWIDENMLQHFVYLKQNEDEFKIISDRGIITCVWELAVLWHERNAWVKHILQKNENPNWEGYLLEQLNDNV